MAAKKEESFGIEYERHDESGAESFSDPFAATPSDAEDYGDVYMSREDYGLTSTTGAKGGSDAFSDFPPSSSSGSGSSSASSSGRGFGAASHVDSGTLRSALGSNQSPFSFGGGGSAAQQQSRPTFGAERRGVWGQASYNIGAPTLGVGGQDENRFSRRAPSFLSPLTPLFFVPFHPPFTPPAGYSYFGGLVLGGLVGLVTGVRSSPNPRPRIVFNSVLNWTGKLGAKCGNAAGVMALLYTVLERQLEDAEFDKLPGAINNTLGMDVFRRYRSDLAIPAATAFATGVLFTLPKAVTMRGVDAVRVTVLKRVAVCGVGGVATVFGVGALSVVGPLVFGDRSPFRFA